MRLNFTTSWIVRAWITCALVIFYAQNAASKSQCDEKHYLRNSRCCKKCEPGFRVFSDCTDTQQTKCVKCNRGEYQPGWTDKQRCLQQKICDPVRGFMERPENLVAEEPCQCAPSLQCYPINCEYCERIPTCNPGYGLEADPESSNGRKMCVACKKGFFSADSSAEPCKQWTHCKAEGRSETRPGSAHADAACGPPVSGAAPSWVIVSVLSVITVLCLLILLLFCYKDKLKLLSVNLRSCVQNLKRTRIQQETYHSGGGGGGGIGGPKCTPCETTKLIFQAPHSPTDDPPCTFPTSAPDVKVTLPLAVEMAEDEGTKGTTEDLSEGSGEPEEVSEEEEEEVLSASPLSAGSCVCVVPIREPLEVGENEDCSQAVSHGTPGTCWCGGLEGDEGGESETGVAAPPSVIPPSSPEVCLPLSEAQVRPEFQPHLSGRSPGKQEDFHRPLSTDPPPEDSSAAVATSSATPLMTSSDLYLDKSAKASGPEQGQGLYWGESGGNNFSTAGAELECTPESLHSQLAEPTLTSGQVSGNHNTTFISSGQVMNFSGDVIVVYVSQTSVGGEGAGQDGAAAFGSPVQEEANETAPFLQSCLRSQGDSISHNTLQEETLPVQEVMVSVGK